jgi:FtsH-binding integral membrane protein
VTFALLLRLAKFVGVLAFAMGIAISLAPTTDDSIRRRAAYWLATPGFLLTWLAGYGLAKMYAISLGRPWITVSMLASLIALHELVRDVEPGRPRSTIRTVVILAALGVSLASMVIRHG